MKKSTLLYVCLSLTILFSAGIFASPKNAFACSCAVSSSAEEQVKGELERKTAIFAGTVTQIKQPRQNIIMSSADLVKVTFEVSTVWKGELANQENIYTAVSSASCGVEDFQVGKEYIVSAYGELEKLETNICDLTKPLASADAELMVLGEGYAPSAQSSSEQSLGTSNSLTMSLIVTIAAVVLGGVIVEMIVRRNSNSKQ